MAPKHGFAFPRKAQNCPVKHAKEVLEPLATI
jgi:hypothetical protein